MNCLLIDKWSCHFPDASSPIIKEMSDSFNEGFIYLIKGNNGSGKTSFFNCLTGIIPEYSPAEISGKLFWNDHDFTPYSIQKKANIFNYLMQNPVKQLVFNDIYTQLTFSACNNSADPFMIKTELSFWLDFFEIKHLLNHKMKELSWGQKKLIHLCSLLINDKPVYLFDEPLAGLSKSYRDKIMDCFLFLKSRYKIIITAEHLEQINIIADRVLDFNLA